MGICAQTMCQLAQQTAAKILADAALVADLHAPSKILFRHDLPRPGAPVVVVRMLWPGVLQVFNPKSGELLAESLPGHPTQLRVDFDYLASCVSHEDRIRHG